MDLTVEFHRILAAQTADCLHDSMIMAIKVDFGDMKLSIQLEHYKDGPKSGEAQLYVSDFIFGEVADISLDNEVNCFGIENDVSSFQVERKNGKDFFTLTAIKGWILSFSAKTIEYRDFFKETYKYL